MKKFADLCRGLFYLSLTGLIFLTAYSLITIWQPLWKDGFEDFNHISNAIENLEKSTQPAIVLFPEIVENMERMNHTVMRMEKTIGYMGNDVEQMKFVMDQQMGGVNYQMMGMNNRFSPWGMMPFNW